MPLNEKDMILSNNLEIFDRERWLLANQATRSALSDRFYAFFSSLIGGIVVDPVLMTVPVDDHLVHRGDGVFESFKCVGGNIYNLTAHLERLQKSARRIGLEMPCSQSELVQTVRETVRAGKHPDCLIRLMISRGTENMGADPEACRGPQLYIVVYKLSFFPDSVREKGARVGLTGKGLKAEFYATIKSCNYISNVLMKKEALERGLDFVVSLNGDGFLGEGATENIGIVTRNRELLTPPADWILEGTTARRIIELGQKLVEEGLLSESACRPVSLSQAEEAKEIFIFGTTPNLLPVTELEGKPVGDGHPGPLAERLLEELNRDMYCNSERLTPVF